MARPAIIAERDPSFCGEHGCGYLRQGPELQVRVAPGDGNGQRGEAEAEDLWAAGSGDGGVCNLKVRCVGGRLRRR